MRFPSYGRMKVSSNNMKGSSRKMAWMLSPCDMEHFILSNAQKQYYKKIKLLVDDLFHQQGVGLYKEALLYEYLYFNNALSLFFADGITTF